MRILLETDNKQDSYNAMGKPMSFFKLQPSITIIGQQFMLEEARSDSRRVVLPRTPYKRDTHSESFESIATN